MSGAERCGSRLARRQKRDARHRRRVGGVMLGALLITLVVGSGTALAVHDDPDLELTKIAADETITAGETASFTIIVRNIGTADALNVVLEDLLPDSGLDWSEAPDLAACTITDDPAGDRLACSVGTLGVGASFSVTVEAPTDVDDCGLLHNAAKVRASNEPKSLKGNNEDSADITVECPVVTLPGRMTGGGSVFTAGGVRVTHGFELHCIFPPGSDPIEPNNLEINWEGNQFHLETLTQGECTDDPNIDQTPPVAPLDTYDGAGFGRYNGVPGAFADWILVDAGEPGTSDTFTLTIVDADGNVVLNVATANLTFGNHQAHKG